VPAFEWPWAFLFLPLPYLVYRFLPAYEAEQQALRVPFFARLGRLAGPRAIERARTRSRLRLALLLVLWLGTLFALARPYEQGAPIESQTAARDLLLAVDLSGSMAQVDLATSTAHPQTRLDIVKRVVGKFVEQRKGDRLGLIVFGTAPFVQVPFTSDTSVVRKLLDETDVGMAGPQTALGDALGLALSVLERSDAKSRAVIALTDGNDTASKVPPLQAARIAAARGVTLHTIGVGDPRAAGEEALNTAVLTNMAQLTHGQFFRANDEQGLERAYQALDRLEPIAHRTTVYQPKRAVGYAPLFVVIGVLGLGALAGTVGNLRRAWASRRAPPAVVAPTAVGSTSHG